MTGAAQYLLVVYLARRREDEPVSPGHVADALEKSPSTATEALQRLAADGLLEYEPYEGATLTASGRDAAEELFDTYETLSRFLREVLELEDPEREAMALLGSVSPRVAERLDETLISSHR